MIGWQNHAKFHTFSKIQELKLQILKYCHPVKFHTKFSSRIFVLCRIILKSCVDL